MQCLLFIWRPGHHRSFEELQGLGKGVMGYWILNLKIQMFMDHSNILPLDPYGSTPIIRAKLNI